MAPCCPDRAGSRGRPYSAHWFIQHDGDGETDRHGTWLFTLPKSDLELASSAREMMGAAGAPLLYGMQTGRWLMWDGSGRYAPQPSTFGGEMTRMLAAWHREAVNDAWSSVRERLERMEAGRVQALAQAEKAWAGHKSFSARLWNDAGQNAIRSQAQAVMGVDESELDAGTGRIIVDNGVISYDQVLRDGYVRLSPHSPADKVTMRMGKGVAWDPDARCPHFEEFLHSSVADAGQRFWLLWRTCTALFGLMRRKGFVNAIGERDSGKSTFTDLIAALAGDYARTVPVETFLSKHGGDSGFRQHELRAARFVYTHEPNQGALYDVSLMKQITGRDAQRTAGKYEKPVEWRPQATPFIGSNAPIRFSTADEAMMSRQEAIRFARGYARPDPFLGERLRGELNGILRMLIDAAVWESRLGHVPDLPLSVVAERERMAIETEDALAFVAEWVSDGRLVEDSDAAAYNCVRVSTLYHWYQTWCEEAGVKPLGRKTMSAVVGRKYPTSRSGGTYGFLGLRTP